MSSQFPAAPPASPALPSPLLLLPVYFCHLSLELIYTTYTLTTSVTFKSSSFLFVCRSSVSNIYDVLEINNGDNWKNICKVGII